jgi:hypothetical protein
LHLTYIGEAVHLGDTGQQTLFIKLKELHAGIQKHPLQYRARDEWCLIACTKEKRYQGVDHPLSEILRESEQLEHDVDRDEGEYNLEHPAGQLLSWEKGVTYLMILSTRPNFLMSFSKLRDSWVG